MKTSNTVWIIVIIIILILGGWYFMWMKSTKTELYPAKNINSSNQIEQKNIEQKSPIATINVSSDPKLGKYLVSSNGMTLYVFAKDTTNISNCYDVCAANWPAYSAPANEPLTLGNGITGQLSTIARTDGFTQITYKGAPLYHFKNDIKPGDTTGQNFGGVWLVSKP